MRIYPLHIFTLLVFLAFESSRYVVNEFFFPLNTPPFKDCSFATLIGNLTMTHSLGFYDSLSWNIPSWSISVEFYVYMFWALSIYIFRKNLLVIGAILFPFICWFIISHNGNLNYTFNYGFIRCLYGFFIGVFAYRLSGWFKNPGFKAATILEFLVLGATLYFIDTVTPPVHWLMAPWFALLVILFSKEAGFLSSRILSNSKLTFMGDLSFSYYLNHVVIIRAYDLLFYKVLKFSHGVFVDLVLIALIILTTHIVSLFTYKYIEMAFYNRKKKAVEPQPELALSTVPAANS
jgi:peptidoglycan/LPS O-acetylase OafA/YrhL